MRDRSISAIAIVALGITPALFGGPVWAVAAVIFGLIGLFEFYRIATNLGVEPLRIGYAAIPLAGLIACLRSSPDYALAPVGFVLIGSAVLVMARNNAPGSFNALASEIFGSIYLAVPVFLGIAVRGLPGSIDTGWVRSTASRFSLGWDANPRGLAWLLFIITVTWLSDTGAFLLGRSIGRTPLLPAISPKKTREGVVGGLIAGVACGVAANTLYGLDLPILVAAAASIVLVAFGVIGDLTESMLKRQASVKDSGTLIRGHGGMLDRIDALLFTWTVGYFMARICDRLWT